MNQSKTPAHGTPPDLNLIWGQYRAALTAFLHARLSDPADVEDVMQEVLIKTHRNIGTLTREESLKSWLFQIAKNTIIDFYRKRARTGAPEAQDLWYEDTDGDAPHVLEDCLAPFIDALPEEMGELLRKVDLEGVSQKEYAQQLGISYSTLKSRVQASRARLRAVFTQCCDFPLDARGNIIGYDPKPGGCGPC